MARGKASDGHKITHQDKRIPTRKDIIEIRVYTGIGFTMQALAEHLAMSKDTLEIWAKEYPDVYSAIRQGRDDRRKRAYACYFAQAFPLGTDGKPTGEGDPSLIKYYMGCREGWREKEKRLTINHEGNAAPVIEYSIKEAIGERETGTKRTKSKG